LAVVLVIGVPIIAGAAYKQLVVVQKRQKQDLECMDEADRVRKKAITSCILFKIFKYLNCITS